jgi:hypothetical protein
VLVPVKIFQKKKINKKKQKKNKKTKKTKKTTSLHACIEELYLHWGPVIVVLATT